MISILTGEEVRFSTITLLEQQSVSTPLITILAAEGLVTIWVVVYGLLNIVAHEPSNNGKRRR